jgi:predicted chitinase
MIISPPFLPPSGLTAGDSDAIDPMMDALDCFGASHGNYPIGLDRRWHAGLHLVPDDQYLPVRAIADGEVVAFRVCQKPISDGFNNGNSNAGFVLLKHTTETGENRKLTFYSLYMHLLDLDAMNQLGIFHPVDDLGNQKPHALLLWLQCPTGAAVSGGGRKVWRKDTLGYLGKLQDLHQMHFEIFMTQGDFRAYFDATQLGHTNVRTPAGTDYWGHSYYVIPAGEVFRALPPGTDKENRLNGIKFDVAQSGQSEHPLQVEVYFHKGDKYTNVWSVGDNGARTLLTETPVVEKGYEYDLYNRATKLYPACPSDGYELLRFGRILSTPATLGATHESSRPLGSGQTGPVLGKPCATWFLVTFVGGKRGYIDINDDAIRKLSDADFPFFMGWHKISESASDSPARTSAPFDHDGLWDLDKLTQIVRAAAGETSPNFDATYASHLDDAEKKTDAQQKNHALRRYVRDPDHVVVRDLLRCFVCEAPSEWDSTHLDARYGKLLEAGEHFEGKQAAYDKFLAFVRKMQFWDATGLPAGEKLWFFHPLAFIRHFRKCGWLSMSETVRSIRSSIRENGKEVAVISKSEVIDRLTKAAERRPANIFVNLQNMARKYGISDSPMRLAHLFGQLTAETGRMQYMLEGGGPSYFDKYEPSQPEGRVLGNTMIGDGARFKGRGLVQLTGRVNYENYGKYRGKIFNTDSTSSLLLSDPYSTCDASGWYWSSKQRFRAINDPVTYKSKLEPFGGLGINYWADLGPSASVILQVTKCINSAGLAIDWRMQGFNNAFYEFNDETLPGPDYKPVK